MLMSINDFLDIFFIKLDHKNKTSGFGFEDVFSHFGIFSFYEKTLIECKDA